ncbi:hypothetical protein CASFOL_031714 [Castilleja foliolosa]|uniref:Uncharacterized protein n=1 Tax=Castilleja foliolosa TaxID=1961234 RepID=A0ABD3C7E5_9LAMI
MAEEEQVEGFMYQSFGPKILRPTWRRSRQSPMEKCAAWLKFWPDLAVANGVANIMKEVQHHLEAPWAGDSDSVSSNAVSPTVKGGGERQRISMVGRVALSGGVWHCGDGERTVNEWSLLAELRWKD